MKRKPIILTASSIYCLFTCPRKYHLSYELGFKKRKTENSFRFGTAFHKGLETWFLNGNAQSSVAAALDTAGDDVFDTETSSQLSALLGGYFLKWGNSGFTVNPEFEFAVRFPFLHGVVVCGKMDGIVTLDNGVKCLIEHKTTSDDISFTSDYWETINRDQIGIYRAACEKLGIDISSVIYDVIRKPTIKMRENDTGDEYYSRLFNDCIGDAKGDNPRAKDYKRGSDFYFARREIPLLDCDMDALARRLYLAVKMIRTYRRIEKTFVGEGAEAIEAWPKCGSSMTCRMCAFRGVCHTSELPEIDWEKGRMYEELTVVKEFL